jgi:imidazolonepropionase-like amidohydrolase
LLAGSRVKVAYGTDCGMFPFSHGVLEFQAMVKAGLSSVRALKAGTSVAAELLGRSDLGVLAPGKLANIVAMPGDPIADIGATAKVDFVMNDGVVDRVPTASRSNQQPKRFRAACASAVKITCAWFRRSDLQLLAEQ